MKHLPSEQKSLRLLPFTIPCSPKALGLGRVGRHQDRDAQSTAAEKAGEKKDIGQYYSPRLSFISNTDITDHTDHIHGDPTMYKLCTSFLF